MAYTKKVDKFDKVTIDGVDVSNSFKEFGRPSAHSDEDASGFSSTGYDETLPGSTAQSFVGVAFHTEELGAIVEPLHRNRTPCVITWQPDGLNDATREVYTGTCTITQWSPNSARGSVGTLPFEAKPSTSAGITVNNWT